MSKKVHNLWEYGQGLWCHYGHPSDDYTASAFTGLDESGKFCVCLSFHKGSMPAFDTRFLYGEAELEQAMRKVQPDLRKWRIA